MVSVPPAHSSPAFVGLHILFVEDDPDVRDAVVTLLEEEGAAVATAATAEEALELLDSPLADAINLVLTDVVLGAGRSGFEVAHAALARRPPLPVVITTGYMGRANAVPDTLPLSVPILLKPFRHAELLAAIAAVLPDCRSSAKSVAA